MHRRFKVSLLGGLELIPQDGESRDSAFSHDPPVPLAGAMEVLCSVKVRGLLAVVTLLGGIYFDGVVVGIACAFAMPSVSK